MPVFTDGAAMSLIMTPLLLLGKPKKFLTGQVATPATSSLVSAYSYLSIACESTESPSSSGLQKGLLWHVKGRESFDPSSD